MTTFSKPSFNTLKYSSFRPLYPDSFYDLLGRYVVNGEVHRIPVSKCIDVGCGTGIASFQLLGLAKEVVGVDPSESMIQTAKKLTAERCQQLGIDDKSRISFTRGTGERLDAIPGLEGEIDLITVAQAIHWLEIPEFFAACSKLLRRGGTLAYWLYIDPDIVNFKGPHRSDLTAEEIMQRAMKIYDEYVYADPQYLGPYWGEPGRLIAKDFYTSVDAHIPRGVFTQQVNHTFLPGRMLSEHASGNEGLILKRSHITIGEWVDYFETYSAFQAYCDSTGDTMLLRGKFIDEIIRETGWDRTETRIDLVWNTKYVFLKRA